MKLLRNRIYRNNHLFHQYKIWYTQFSKVVKTKGKLSNSHATIQIPITGIMCSVTLSITFIIHNFLYYIFWFESRGAYYFFVFLK